MPRPKGHKPTPKFKIICNFCGTENLTAYPKKLYCTLNCRNLYYKKRYKSNAETTAPADSAVVSSPSSDQWKQLADQTPKVPGEESK